MGVSELRVVIAAEKALEPRMSKLRGPAVSPTMCLVEAGMKRSKSEKKRFQQLVAAVPAAKHYMQHTMVHTLYPVIKSLRIPLPLSPQGGPQEDDLEEEEDAVSGTQMAIKWLLSDAAEQFEERIQSLVDCETLQLELTSEGCGGVYFMRNGKNATKAIFKPRDEEYMAPCNPRGYVKEGSIVGTTAHPVNKGFRIGNGALRERVAYVLDAAYGNFSGVPVTTLTKMPIEGVMKEGSMQAFVESECSSEDMGTLRFSIPEVHKIGILDLRLFNTDRHGGNILLQAQANDQTYAMTPIDHGFCLPSFKHLDNACFEWLYWPQTQFPFTSAALDHIASLNVDRDAAMCRALGIAEDCVTTLRICTTLLKIGADAGFSLFEIASHFQREGDYSAPSPLEEVVAQAMETVTSTTELREQENAMAFYDLLVAEVEAAAVALFAGQPKRKVRSISCFS